MVDNQQEIWEEIAPEWTQFRTRSIQEVQNFLKDKQGKVLDLGCGSGRNFVKIKGTIYAVDFSKNMLKYAKKLAKKEKIKTEFIQSKASDLPFEDNFFDSAIFIDALHCINEENKRNQTIKELFRTLKPNAQALITVWSRNQKRIKNRIKETTVPWTKNEKKYERYCYIYDQKELENLIKKAGFQILSSKEEKRLIFIVQKPK